MPADPKLTYSFSCDGFISEDLTFAALAKGGQPHRVEPRPFARVSGVVVAPTVSLVTLTPQQPEAKRHVVQTISAELRLAARSNSLAENWGRSGVGVSGPVDSKGAFSIQVAIPREQPSFEQVAVVLSSPNGVERKVATIPRLHPGSDVVIEDPWVGAPALRLLFQDSSGRPLAVGERVHLGRVPTEASQPGAPLVGTIDKDGGVSFSHVPLGKWHYAIWARRVPSLWQLSGSIVHGGEDQAILLSHNVEPLVVKIATPKGEEEGNQRRPQFGLLLGAVEANGTPFEVRTVWYGDSVKFPFAPHSGNWSLVLSENVRGFQWDGRQTQQADAEPQLRVPIHSDDREIVLRMDPK